MSTSVRDPIVFPARLSPEVRDALDGWVVVEVTRDGYQPGCPACGHGQPYLHFDGGPHLGKPSTRQMRCVNLPECGARGPVEVQDEKTQEYRRV